MTIQLANFEISPPVLLAPMAGITDLPFRRLVTRFGAGLVISEMIGSQEMVQGKTDTRAKAELGLGQARSAVQIAGRDAYWMAEAARLAEAGGARLIDINMGCPAKKVTSGYSGSALMKTPDHALSLIEAVVGAVRVPVTLKMRLGWDTATQNAAALARRAEEAGVRMVTVHGRTRCQFYKGAADWAAIRAVRDALTIPVIANGDITSAATARAALAASGAAGVMIGRGARGRPWIPAQIAHALFGSPPVAVPTGAERAEMIGAHYEDMLSFYGRDLGVRTARKHLGWYLDDIAVPAELRRAILTETDPANVLSQIGSVFAGAECPPSEGPANERQAA